MRFNVLNITISITVVDVALARDEHEHEEKVKAWARSVWQSWSHYHSVIADLAREL